jgi:dTDP-4-amino-4,6-dideoxygalactose transaminase
MSRNEMMEIFQQMGIATRPGTHAVHMLGAYSERYGFKPEDFPGAFAADQYSMAIPLHNKMVKEDYDYIIEAIKSL